MKLKTVKLKCEVEVPYWSYDTKSKNAKASSYITKWVRETIKNECSFIPMYVEKDDDGSYREDCSKKTKVKVKKIK